MKMYVFVFLFLVFETMGQSIFDGNEFKINDSNIDNSNRNVSIASFTDGSFVVCWPNRKIVDEESLYAIICQLYNAEGEKVGSPLEIEEPISSEMIFPEIAALPSNSLALCWSTFYYNSESESVEKGLWYQKIVYEDNALLKTGEPIRIDNDGSDQIGITTHDDKFLICWANSRQGDEWWQGILAKVYNSDGTEVTDNELRINVTNGGYQHSPKVEALNDKFLVIWTAPDSSEDGVWGQFIKFDGDLYKNNFQVNTFQEHGQAASSITQLQNGNIIITYNGWEGVLSSGTELYYFYDIFGQIFTGEGIKVGEEFLINSDTLGNQYASRAELVGDNLVVVWHTKEGIYRIRGQLLDIYGNKISNEFTVSTPIEGSEHDEFSEIVSIKDEGYVVCWTRCKMNEWTGNTWGRYLNLDSASTSIENNLNEKVTEFKLENNYPNPFNPSTTISYSLPQNSFVQLKVYDLLGHDVANLVNKEQAIGNYKVEFNASNLSSGIYFYKLKSGNFVDTKKLILLR